MRKYVVIESLEYLDNKLTTKRFTKHGKVYYMFTPLIGETKWREIVTIKEAKEIIKNIINSDEELNATERWIAKIRLGRLLKKGRLIQLIGKDDTVVRIKAA